MEIWNIPKKIRTTLLNHLKNIWSEFFNQFLSKFEAFSSLGVGLEKNPRGGGAEAELAEIIGEGAKPEILPKRA